MRYNQSIIITLAALVLACSSCRETTDPEQADFDREQLLTNLADNVIIPRYDNYYESVLILDESAQDFVAAPDNATLSEVREAWRNALLSWQRVAMFEFGPAEQVALQANTNVYPTDTAQIISNISSQNYDLAWASNLDAKGFPAIDFLLFGSENDEQTVADFGSQPLFEERGQYLLDLTNSLLTNAETVYNDWNTSIGNYRSDFVSNTGTDVGSSLGQLLNAVIQSYEQVTRTQKLGLPSGATTFSQNPLPDHVEAYYEYDNNVAYISESMDAFKGIYAGDGEDGQSGIGFDDYLVFLDSEYNGGDLNTAILSQIGETSVAVSELSDPLSEFVVQQQDQAIQVYSEMQQLVIFWKVDMMSALGILITYQDNDGD